MKYINKWDLMWIDSAKREIIVYLCHGTQRCMSKKHCELHKPNQYYCLMLDLIRTNEREIEIEEEISLK